MFETKVVILIEFGLPPLRVEEYDENTNSVWLQANLDLIEESRELTVVRMTVYHQRMVRYYNAWIKIKEFHVDDLVLQRTEISQLTKQEKLSPN